MTANGIAGYLNLPQPAPPLTVVSAASFSGGSARARLRGGRVRRRFCFRAALSSNPPHTELENITVNVQDSTGTDPPGPTLSSSPRGRSISSCPAGTVPGSASVIRERDIVGDAPLPRRFRSHPVAPAPVHCRAGNRRGLHRSRRLRRSHDGRRCSAIRPGTIVPVPIDLSQSEARGLHLILFGTRASDGAPAQSTSVSVQGVSVPAVGLGPQPTDVGLDQINVSLPASLAGTGVASVSVSIGGQTSNIVYVTIR